MCYLHNRRQKFDISVNNAGSYSSTLEIVKRGVPHGSGLWPLLFITCINDLTRHINHLTKFVLFADDRNILITEKIMEISSKRLGLL